MRHAHPYRYSTGREYHGDVIGLHRLACIFLEKLEYPLQDRGGRLRAILAHHIQDRRLAETHAEAVAGIAHAVREKEKQVVTRPGARARRWNRLHHSERRVDGAEPPSAPTWYAYGCPAFA